MLFRSVAGGGLFVAYDKVSDASAEVLLKAHLRNDSRKTFTGVVEYETEGEVKTMPIEGGFVDVNNNRVAICIQ